MVKMVQKRLSPLERISLQLTYWVGTPLSILAHTAFFIGIFILMFFGLSLDKVLLILTTAVSLEAIYLAIFIQFTVNRNTQSLEAVEEDIEDIQEDVEDLEGDVEDISEDMSDEEQAHRALLNIQSEIKRLQEDLKILQKKGMI